MRKLLAVLFFATSTAWAGGGSIAGGGGGEDATKMPLAGGTFTGNVYSNSSFWMDTSSATKYYGRSGSASANNLTFQFRDDTDTGFYLSSAGRYDFVVDATSVFQMRATSMRSMLNGTAASPAITLNNNADTGIYWGAGNNFLKFSNDGVARIDTSAAGVNFWGLIGVDHENPCSTCTLHVGGATGNGSFTGTLTQNGAKSCSTGTTTDATGKFDGCVASDARLKSHVADFVASAPGLIDRLKARSYRWREDAKRDDRDHVGFVAQEVEQVLPEAVVGAGADGIKGIDSNALIALLVADAQRTHRQIKLLWLCILGLSGFCLISVWRSR